MDKAKTQEKTFLKEAYPGEFEIDLLRQAQAFDFFQYDLFRIFPGLC
jgi:hypothetical protein